jgi:hypothetical protein
LQKTAYPNLVIASKLVMLHGLIEQHADESCCNSGPQDQSAKLGIWHRGRLMAVAPTFVTEVGQHLRRDNHHERQDWLSRTKAIMAVPARPSPSHCSLADPFACDPR